MSNIYPRLLPRKHKISFNKTCHAVTNPKSGPGPKTSLCADTFHQTMWLSPERRTLKHVFITKSFMHLNTFTTIPCCLPAQSWTRSCFFFTPRFVFFFSSLDIPLSHHYQGVTCGNCKLSSCHLSACIMVSFSSQSQCCHSQKTSALLTHVQISCLFLDVVCDWSELQNTFTVNAFKFKCKLYKPCSAALETMLSSPFCIFEQFKEPFIKCWSKRFYWRHERAYHNLNVIVNSLR